MNLFDKLSHPLANRPGLQLILLLPFRLAQACVSVERLSNFLAPDNLEGYALHCPSGCWYVVDAGEVLSLDLRAEVKAVCCMDSLAS